MATQIITYVGNVAFACERTINIHEARVERWQDDWSNWYELPWWKRWFTKEPRPTWRLREENDYMRAVEVLEGLVGDEEATVFIDVNDARAIGMTLNARGETI